MDYQPFYTLFPKIAEKETRRIIVLRDDEKLPRGEYGFLPSYCTENDCDCRRAFVLVLNPELTKHGHLATISYGWEPMKFYLNWSLGLSEDDLKEFKGPALDSFQTQSVYAEELLKLFKNDILADPDYILRMKRHYAYFKRKIGMKLPPELNALLRITEPCPCRSGDTFIKCCGKMDMRFRRR